MKTTSDHKQLTSCLWEWMAEASILGAEGQFPPPPSPMKILGGKHIVFPLPNHFDNLKKFIICNANVGFNSTVRHYKSIKFNQKNISKYTQFSILRLYCDFSRGARRKIRNFPYSCAPPPPPHPKNGSTPLLNGLTKIMVSFVVRWNFHWGWQ